MARFISFRSRAIPLLTDNFDTDQIIPARFLKATDKKGFGEKLFNDWRYNPDGTPKRGFPLNDPANKGAEILVAGDNFGCGSSREHAPWALTSFGFKAVVSTSFADIFKNNALKNGLLPVVILPHEHRQLVGELSESPGAEVSVNLEQQELTFPGGMKVGFPIDAFAKKCLMNGVDELEYLRQFSSEVERYESARGW
jgi:3-isopropylmalate/(R)-2-methylmalate dehydratase small subunit